MKEINYFIKVFHGVLTNIEGKEIIFLTLHAAQAACKRYEKIQSDKASLLELLR
jgi:hypothetical protein